MISLDILNAGPVRNPIRNLVNSLQRSYVETVIINGEIVIEKGMLTTIGVDRLIRDVQRSAERIWKRLPDNHYLHCTADEASPLSLKH